MAQIAFNPDDRFQELRHLIDESKTASSQTKNTAHIVLSLIKFLTPSALQYLVVKHFETDEPDRGSISFILKWDVAQELTTDVSTVFERNMTLIIQHGELRVHRDSNDPMINDINKWKLPVNQENFYGILHIIGAELKKACEEFNKHREQQV